MYIHKYLFNGEAFYRISESSAKPSKTISLNSEDWVGKVSGNRGLVKNAIANIEHAINSSKKEEIEEENSKEKKVKTKKTSSYANLFKGLIKKFNATEAK